MAQTRRREPLPPCGHKTDRGFLCIRPARWTLTKDQAQTRACTIHTKALLRAGWARGQDALDASF
jgi:hypothetical protein